MQERTVDQKKREEQAAVDYTDLQVMLGPIYDSDYMPFEALGYVVAGLYDGGAIDQNTHYHSSTDIPSAVNMDYVVSTTKLLLATILQETRNTPSAQKNPFFVILR